MEKNSRRKCERRKLIVSNTIKISFWPKILLIYTKQKNLEKKDLKIEDQIISNDQTIRVLIKTI